MAAVERQTGVPSRWSGDVYEELDPDALASVDEHGAISLSVVDVIEPIELSYARVRLADADVAAIRDAFATVIHEAAHLSTRDGDATRPDAHPPADAAGEALDEGLIENWMRENFATVVQDTGLDTAVPGVLDEAPTDAYPAYSSAVRTFLRGLAPLSGRSVGELEETIRTTELSQRWNAIADIVIDRNLAGSMPAGDRPVIRESLANGLRANFMRARSIQEHPKLDAAPKRQQGIQIGQRAVSELELEVGRLEDGYRARQGPSRVRAVSPEKPVTPGPVDADVEHLRRIVGGGAPAAGAVRMELGQAARVSYRVSAASRAAFRAR